jgi:hypothetical protein
MGTKVVAQINGRKGGRPKGSLSSKTIEQKMAIDILREKVQANIKPLVDSLIERGLDKDTAAVKELFDRAWGRSPQSLDISNKVTFQEPSERIKELAKRLKELD